MVQTNKLRGLFVENGMSYKDVAKAIGISESTMARRMKKGVFYVSEIKKIIEMFNLPYGKGIEIFFYEGNTVEKMKSSETGTFKRPQ